jgi:signal transduction histidine kinase
VTSQVLLVEDNLADAVLVSELLRGYSPGEFTLSVCGNLHDAHESLDAASPDCVLLDLSLSDAQGLDGVDSMQERHRAIPLVVLTGNPDGVLALRAVHRGAQDYLVKSAADAGQIAQAIRYAVVRKRAEVEIEEAKNRFFASVSHDLRTPLACIIGYLEVVREESDGLLGADLTSFLGVAAENAERLRRLVNDVLFMAGARASGADMKCAEIELADVAHSAADAIRPFADAKRIVLTVECEPPAPVWGDADRLGQVLDNLLANAIKYTSGGGEVSVRVTSVAGFATVAVSDNGIGISTDDRAHVFEYFFRASSVRDAPLTGVGLGLSIVKTIVDAHGGTVNVESTPGAGSCFTVVLPQAPAPQSPGAKGAHR